jgi:hypothetical protein
VKLTVKTGNKYNEKKDLAFSISIGPVMGFLQELIAINPTYNTISNCSNFSPFSACHLKWLFTPLLKTLNDCNWSFHFSASLIVDNPVLYETINSPLLSPLSSHLIIKCF